MTTDVTTPSDPRRGARRGPDAGSGAAAHSTAIGTYRPGLDGMRGLAMLCMLGYHGEVAWCRGAFLALSQFFTLSGFLITGVLLRNHLQPGGELKSFWSRRIRRLMPAAILALVRRRPLRRDGRHPPAGRRASRRRVRGGHLDRELALHPRAASPT